MRFKPYILSLLIDNEIESIVSINGNSKETKSKKGIDILDGRQNKLVSMMRITMIDKIGISMYKCKYLDDAVLFGVIFLTLDLLFFRFFIRNSPHKLYNYNIIFIFIIYYIKL